MDKLNFKENVALAPYTYYKIGGSAAYFVEAKTPEDVEAAVNFAGKKCLPFFILGAGSNILVSDNGFSGIVIHLEIKNFEVVDGHVRLGAGLQMAEMVAKSVQASLTGMEWAIGIPGTVGGSVRGNAGCFGGEIKDITRQVQIFDTKTKVVRWIDVKECAFGYRTSIFKSRPEWVILQLEILLSHGNSAISQELIRNFSKKRVSSQAIGSKSAGCIFKNVSWGGRNINREHILKRFPDLKESGTVPGIAAASCIELAGLKGFKIGGAEISKTHANYFINNGDATAEEVVILIAIAKDRVRRIFGFSLEEEIQYVGF